jgi:hypothetical protein
MYIMRLYAGLWRAGTLLFRSQVFGALTFVNGSRHRINEEISIN